MTNEDAKRIALVTGAGREQGLGFEVCQQLARGGATVLLTARGEAKARARSSDRTRSGSRILRRPAPPARPSRRGCATSTETSRS